MLISIDLASTKTKEEPLAETQFPNPAGVKTFTGFGADESDLVRGFLQPDVRADAKYDKVNYSERYTEPKMPDEGPGNHESLSRDFEFRQKERVSRGFLTRPKIPTER